MSIVKIVTDSASDMSPEMARRLDVVVVSLVVNFGSESCLDSDLDNETFWIKAKSVHPQTSQPPVGAFESAFAPLVEGGAEVICITVTGKHSGTFNSATMAAQRFGGKVNVWDSYSISWGQIFQVEVAVEAANQGKSAPEILAILADTRQRLQVNLVLDTIEFLKKGGRASKFISIVEKVVSFFHIKPLITFKEGELKLLGTANSFTRGLLRLEREALALEPLEKLAVMHIRNAEVAKKFAENLKGKLAYPLAEVPVLETGAVLSCHGGPGTIALAALPKPKA
jgi:DegV family protein with EDD domain